MEKLTRHVHRPWELDGGLRSEEKSFFHTNINFYSINSFTSCAESNLNGVWRDEPLGNEYQGIFWEHWLGDYSLKASKMMVRPKDVWFSNPDEDLSDLGNELEEN